MMQDLLGHIWFLVLLILVNLLGLLLFGVGLLVTIPVSVAAVAAAYQVNVGFQHRPPEPARPVIIP